MKKVQAILNQFRDSVADETVRFRIQFLWVNRVLTAVALFMSVVNIFTQKYLLLGSTAVFALLCLLNVLLVRDGEKSLKVAVVLFSVEIIALFTFFLIAGTPEGFSVIWCCLLPACGLLLFGRKRGTYLSAAMLAILIFFFWTPVGQSALQYNYTGSFRLRFPMLYAAFYAVALFLETIRQMTQDQLTEAREKYRFLYSHDALTGVFNRYGFNEQLDRAAAGGNPEGFALMILDLDLFKNVNDRYGHLQGDAVLKALAALLLEKTGDRGVVCRWGGEEFAVLLNRAAGAGDFAESLRREVERMRVSAAGEVIAVTASIGAVAVPGPDKADPAALVTRTDRCLYRAKGAGRNRAVWETMGAAE